MSPDNRKLAVKGAILIEDSMVLNNITSEIAYSALIAILVEMCHASGLTFDQFKENIICSVNEYQDIYKTLK